MGSAGHPEKFDIEIRPAGSLEVLGQEGCSHALDLSAQDASEQVGVDPLLVETATALHARFV